MDALSVVECKRHAGFSRYQTRPGKQLHSLLAAHGDVIIHEPPGRLAVLVLDRLRNVPMFSHLLPNRAAVTLLEQDCAHARHDRADKPGHGSVSTRLGDRSVETVFLSSHFEQGIEVDLSCYTRLHPL